MADGVFNIAKGFVGNYAALGEGANDALIVVLIVASGLEADDTLNNHDNLSVLLASTNDEATFTNYARKVVSASITTTVDDTNNRVDIDMPDLTWTSAGGGTNNSISKLLVCYDNDTTAGTDTSIVPLTYHDFVVTTDGSDLTAQVATAGFYRAA
jgi:mannitol-1-phosphate/altronate dehydrogenase